MASGLLKISSALKRRDRVADLESTYKEMLKSWEMNDLTQEEQE